MLALWVILYHLTSPGMLLYKAAQGLPAVIAGFLHGGYLAVGCFFVLSGFVLARSYASTGWNAASLRRYAANRVARIYPVYLLSLLMVTPLIVMEGVSGKPGLILNYVLVLQGWSGKLAASWNTPAWSLTCEIFFYLCFPLVLIAVRKPRWTIALALMGGAFFMPNVLRRAGVLEIWKPLIHFADFLAGMAAAPIYALLLRHKERFEGRGTWFYLPAAFLIAVLILRPDLVGDTTPLGSAMRPLNCALIIGLALGGGFGAQIFSHPRSVLLGKASYAMYILHIPLLWWYNFVYVTSWIPGVASSLLYVTFVIAVSILVYGRIEEPWNNRIRDFLSKGRSVTGKGGEIVVENRRAMSVGAAG